jgi:hypothetical protein
VSINGTAVHGGTIIMAWVVGVLSNHDEVTTRAGEVPVSCLLGEGKPEPPSPPEAMRNFLVESPIMARGGYGSPLQFEPMKVASNPSLLGERLRPPKQSAMKSRLPKVNGFTEGEATARQTFTVSDDDERL